MIYIYITGLFFTAFLVFYIQCIYICIIYIYIYIYIYMHIYIYNIHIHTHTHIHTCTYIIYIYIAGLFFTAFLFFSLPLVFDFFFVLTHASAPWHQSIYNICTYLSMYLSMYLYRYIDR